MNSAAQTHFISCYCRILARTWSDEEFSELLEADPLAVLAASGLTLRPDARISVIRSVLHEPDVWLQLALWEDGDTTGNYVLHVPALNARKLTEVELDNLTGGSACRCEWCNRFK
jgi:hypothetical protein